MLLKDSEYREDADFRQINRLLAKADFAGDEYKEDFSGIVDTLQSYEEHVQFT